jgi:hypothetical protein
MPPRTDQTELLKNFDLQFIRQGSEGGWIVGKDIYLQCPRCQTYVTTNDYDECACGCISIDFDYARISVRGEPESSVGVYRAVQKR